jgi:hypothetical protein
MVHLRKVANGHLGKAASGHLGGSAFPPNVISLSWVGSISYDGDTIFSSDGTPVDLALDLVLSYNEWVVEYEGSPPLKIISNYNSFAEYRRVSFQAYIDNGFGTMIWRLLAEFRKTTSGETLDSLLGTYPFHQVQGGATSQK